MVVFAVEILSSSSSSSSSICVCDETDLGQNKYTIILKELQTFTFGTWNVDKMKTPRMMTYKVQASV